MTDKVLIDRSVLEQASKLLQALSVDDNYGYAGDFRYWENYEPPEKLASTLRAALEQPRVEQEPTPNGATHRQPKQGAFYKRVDGKWYVWSRMENGGSHRWYISPGTTESCLDPIYTHPQPKRKPLTHEWIRMIYDECDAETGDEFIFAFARAIERAHGIVGE